MSYRPPLLYDPLEVNHRLKWILAIAVILMVINVIVVVYLKKDGPAYLSASDREGYVQQLVAR